MKNIDNNNNNNNKNNNNNNNNINNYNNLSNDKLNPTKEEQKNCSINLFCEIEKFTKIAILGGLIAYLSLTFNRKDLINETNSIKNIYGLDILASTFGVIVTFYFFRLSLKQYNKDETNKTLLSSQNLNVISSFILFVIEILRFIDGINVNNLRLSFLDTNTQTSIKDNDNENNIDTSNIFNIQSIFDIIPEVAVPKVS